LLVSFLATSELSARPSVVPGGRATPAYAKWSSFKTKGNVQQAMELFVNEKFAPSQAIRPVETAPNEAALLEMDWVTEDRTTSQTFLQQAGCDLGKGT
jgi:hypothetical protein